LTEKSDELRLGDEKKKNNRLSLLLSFRDYLSFFFFFHFFFQVRMATAELQLQVAAEYGRTAEVSSLLKANPNLDVN